MLRAAIIGCGPHGPQRGGVHSIAYAHAWAMGRFDDSITLVAAASRNRENLSHFTAEFPGITGFQDYREMLQEVSPDFVSLCAFPPDREAMVEAALHAGARVLWVEKPFAISMSAAERMISMAEEFGARVFVNYQRRFGAPFVWAKQKVMDGAIGRIQTVEVVHPESGIINFGPHLFDAVFYLLGSEPAQVHGAVEWAEGRDYQGVPVEESLIAEVILDEGGRMIVSDRIGFRNEVPAIRVNGSEGFIELWLGGPARLVSSGGSEVCPSSENFHHGERERNLYVERALADILHAVKNDAPSRIEAREVLPGLRALLGLFASARAGKPLSIADADQCNPLC